MLFWIIVLQITGKWFSLLTLLVWISRMDHSSVQWYGITYNKFDFDILKFSYISQIKLFKHGTCWLSTSSLVEQFCILCCYKKGYVFCFHRTSRVYDHCFQGIHLSSTSYNIILSFILVSCFSHFQCFPSDFIFNITFWTRCVLWCNGGMHKHCINNNC